MTSQKSIEGNGVEILIAEDSPTQAEQLRHIVAQRYKHVTVAPNGKEALLAARGRKPSLIISDIVMPEMNGYDLCRAIKSDAGLSDVPVVLVTTLSDPKDVIEGLACGADNFIRKPYREEYLLSRIGQILANRELRKSEKMQMGMEIVLGGRRHFINAERRQILDLLIGTYEEAVRLNDELRERERALAHSNRSLMAMFGIAQELNKAATERAVAEGVLKRALELPGVRAGWISVLENGNFRALATCNLPPALEAPGAMDGLCACRRKLLSGELDGVTNILECERLQKAKGDKQGLLYHASVPIWIGQEAIGVMNLVGSERGLFNDDDLRNLYAVGDQLGIALARTRLVEQLEAANRRIEAAYHELKEAQVQLVQSAKMASLGQLVAGVAHEINNPLAFVMNHQVTVARALDSIAEEAGARLSATGARSLQKARERSAGMQMGMERIKDLVLKLRTFSRLDEGEIKFVKIEESIEAVITLLQHRLQDRIRLTRKYGAIKVVACYPGPLNQVIMNVLSNAIDAIEGGGEITIATGKDDSMLFISITDTGKGIPAAIRERIFEPFYTTKPVGQGTGLGLSISYGIIQRHKGVLAVQSEEGKGTTVIIKIPLNPGDTKDHG